MILSLTIASLLSGTPCTLTGKLTFKSDDPASEIGEVVVFVKFVNPKRAPKAENTTHNILQSNLQFKPRVFVALKGDTVQFFNEDKDLHNVFSPNSVPKFDFPPTAQGVTGPPIVFMEPGPARILCNIHSKMRSDVLVVQNHFFSFVQANGTFSIGGLPAGEYTVVAWERNGSQVEKKGVKCEGPTRVQLPTLVEARPPKPQRLDGMIKVYGG